MKSFIYKFAFLVALIALVSGILSGVSLFTSVLRSAVVFLGTILVMILAFYILRWSLSAPPQSSQAMTKQGAIEEKDK